MTQNRQKWPKWPFWALSKNDGFFGHFQKMSFLKSSGLHRSGWSSPGKKVKKTWKKPVILGRWGVKNRQKSRKWVRGPPYSPQKTAFFGDFCQNDDFWKSRKSNPEIVSEIDTNMTKNAKNAKNDPKPTFFKKCHFGTFLTPWSNVKIDPFLPKLHFLKT